jgi:hypothetical protein
MDPLEGIDLDGLLHKFRTEYEERLAQARAALVQRQEELSTHMKTLSDQATRKQEDMVPLDKRVEEWQRKARKVSAAESDVFFKMHTYRQQTSHNYDTWLSAALETRVVRGAFGDFISPVYIAQWKREGLTGYALQAEIKAFDARVREHLEDFINADPAMQEMAAKQTRLRELSRKVNTLVSKLGEIQSSEREEYWTIRRQLTSAEQEMRSIRDGTHQSLPRPPGELAYLARVKKVYEANPVPSIEKNYFSFKRMDNRGYSLWYGGSLVMQRTPKGQYEYIFTTAKAKPFAIHRTKQEVRDEKYARSLVNLGIYDFVTADGVKLNGAARDIADQVFSIVRNGIEMFPEENEKGYRVHNPPSGNGREHSPLVSRHWGQSHLADQSPDEITQGQLWGSGHSYKAYRFGGVVIVESDRTNDATYVLTAPHFASLRAASRSQLLRTEPEGFLGRVIHTGSEDDSRTAWTEEIAKYIQQHRDPRLF